ncbi:MAG: DUF1127 domain-containing protein [Pelagimonas sp.]|jgi:uncharacterized protein YjiS (DUF1127 family)|nr:DUF1127 domain-containing protein [Pelagimonas sp.]
MALASDLNSRSQTGPSAFFTTLVAELRARIARRRVYRNTLSELTSLSDRELSDLGLNRSVIRRIAWQAAYEG